MKKVWSSISSIFSQQKMSKYSTLVLASLISMIFATVIIYSSVRSNLISKNVDDTVNNLDIVIHSHTAVFEQAESALGSLSSNPELSKIPEILNKGEYVRFYRTFNQLQNLQRQYDFIQNITIYYFDEMKILATEWGLSSSDSYTDLNLPDTEHDMNNPKVVIELIHLKTSYEDVTTFRIGSYLSKDYKSKPSAYIAITLDNQYLKDLHLQMKPKEGEFILADSSRNLIYSSLDSAESFVELLPDPTVNPGQFSIRNLEIDKTDILLINKFSPGYNLLYSYLIPMSLVVQDANFMITGLIVMILGIVMISLFTGIFSLKKLYKPIDNIMDVVSKHNHLDPVNISKLAQRIESIYSENESLESKNKFMTEYVAKYKLYQRNVFLSNITKERYDLKYIVDNLSFHEITFSPDDHFAVILFSLDQDEKNDPMHPVEWRIVSFHLMQMLRRKFPKPFNFECVENEDHNLYILVNKNTSFSEDDGFIEQIEDLHDRVTHIYGIHATVGISTVQSSIAALPSCRKEAEKARDSRWFYGLNQIISYDPMNENDNYFQYPYEIEKGLNFALRNNQPDEAANQLMLLYNYIFETAGNDIRVCQYYYIQIFSATYRTLYEWHPILLSELRSERENLLLLLSVKTINELYTELKNLYKAVFIQLEKHRQFKHSQLVNDVILYIQENYFKDLSIDLIAEEFRMSASHLRRLFREETSTSIKNYIDGVRISKAKYLLLETQKNLADIAQCTGFFSDQTFRRVFKKETGHLPNDYRRIFG